VKIIQAVDLMAIILQTKYLLDTRKFKYFIFGDGNKIIIEKLFLAYIKQIGEFPPPVLFS